METTNKKIPIAQLLLSDIDIELIQSLTKHWVVIVERQPDNQVRIEIFER